MNRFQKVLRALKWQRQIRAAVSTQLSLIEGGATFALGGLTSEEGARVCELVREASAFRGPIVEFGTLFGLTTRLMAGAKSEGQAIISVDNFCWNPFGLTPRLHEQFTRRILVTELARGEVDLHATDSETFRHNYRGATPALVFFDADHSYAAVRDEIEWAKAEGVPLICGHDYGNARFGVTRAVDEALPGGVQVCGMVWSWRKAGGASVARADRDGAENSGSLRGE